MSSVDPVVSGMIEIKSKRAVLERAGKTMALVPGERKPVLLVSSHQTCEKSCKSLVAKPPEANKLGLVNAIPHFAFD